MMVKAFFLIGLMVCCLSCSPVSRGIFGKDILHDKYGEKLKSAGLEKTAMGMLWFNEAENALAQPQTITLPYQEFGFFPAENPRAVGLAFAAKQGAKLLFHLEKNPDKNFALFADLWKKNDAGNPSFLQSADTSQSNFEYEVENNGTFILRLQPELLKSGDYTLTISVGASLDSPVAGNKGKIGSVWGDERDAGERRHEGIDLFAPFRTPAMAAADGRITTVNENNLGGKVIWLKPEGKNITLYYAHLDSQMVTGGQRVHKGDTIGLIGNTGNARSTPPHLHFGVYTYKGAIDPFPFINPVVKEPEKVLMAAEKLKGWFRADKNETISVYDSRFILKANTLLTPVAVSAKSYRMQLPNGMFIQIPVGTVQSAEKPIHTAKLKESSFLYDLPNTSAPRKLKLLPATVVSIQGIFNDFAFVSLQKNSGWLPLSVLNN